MKNEKKIIPAIFSEDIRHFLEINGELIPIENGERFCIICNQPINIETIQAIIPCQGKIQGYVCSNNTCMIEYNNKKNGK